MTTTSQFQGQTTSVTQTTIADIQHQCRAVRGAFKASFSLQLSQGVRAIVNRLIDPRPAYANSSGVPYSGGVLSFFASGTSTPLSVYSGSDLTGASTTITLNSAGRPSQEIFLATVLYKMTLTDVLGNPIFTADPVYTSDYSTLAKAQGYSGNPNTHVAGTASAGAIPADLVWDRSNNTLYVCTVTGSAAAAVWTVANVTALSAGTTAARNVSPTAGVDFRYNTTLNGLEYWNGTAWIVLGQQPTVQRLTTAAGATYTAPTGVVRQRVRMVGAGGGGGAGATNAGAASASDTSFQVNAAGTAWTAVKGGGGGTSGGSPGIGGTGGTDGSTGTLIARFAGAAGGSAFASAAGTLAAGNGGSSPFGGAGPGIAGGTGQAAKANTGSGGGGGGIGGGNGGAGGGAGEYVELWCNAATATYTVGAGGAAGAAGTQAGGAGGSGYIIVEEFYS